MIYEIIRCRYCQSEDLRKNGMRNGRQRCYCKSCKGSFQLGYTHKAYEPGVKEQIVPMAMNGGGVRDTARVLGINKNTVIAELKKSAEVCTINPYCQGPELDVEIRHELDASSEVEMDEQWSYVGSKDNPRWLWYAWDRITGMVRAFVCGRRPDEVFKAWLGKLDHFNIHRYYTDDWQSYRT